jgi:hypothetical protein
MRVELLRAALLAVGGVDQDHALLGHSSLRQVFEEIAQVLAGEEVGQVGGPRSPPST